MPLIFIFGRLLNPVADNPFDLTKNECVISFCSRDWPSENSLVMQLEAQMGLLDAREKLSVPEQEKLSVFELLECAGRVAQIARCYNLNEAAFFGFTKSAPLFLSRIKAEFETREDDSNWSKEERGRRYVEKIKMESLYITVIGRFCFRELGKHLEWLCDYNTSLEAAIAEVPNQSIGLETEIAEVPNQSIGLEGVIEANNAVFTICRIHGYRGKTEQLFHLLMQKHSRLLVHYKMALDRTHHIDWKANKGYDERAMKGIELIVTTIRILGVLRTKCPIFAEGIKTFRDDWSQLLFLGDQLIIPPCDGRRAFRLMQRLNGRLYEFVKSDNEIYLVKKNANFFEKNRVFKDIHLILQHLPDEHIMIDDMDRLSVCVELLDKLFQTYRTAAERAFKESKYVEGRCLQGEYYQQVSSTFYKYKELLKDRFINGCAAPLQSSS